MLNFDSQSGAGRFYFLLFGHTVGNKDVTIIVLAVNL